MRVPEWAAVNEAVNLEDYKSKSVVNAVLRNFLRERDKIKLPSEDSVDYIAISTSHPKWLIKRWIRRFGLKETLDLAMANNKIPPITLRVEEPEKREYIIDYFKNKGINAFLAKYSPAGLYLEGFPSILHDEIENLKLYIQDEAAQLVTYLLNPLPNERVLDACAAPGGKTTHIAQLMKDKGEIIAVEVDERRIKTLIENIRRLKLASIKVIQSDIKDLKDSRPFDKILIDAPCSSIGVIRRNPDIKYHRTKKDLNRYKKRQIEVIKSASRFLKKNGIMVYSVCSTEQEEGEDVIRQFLRDRGEFIPIEGDYNFLEPFKITANDLIYYRTFPHRHNMDGFFMVRLKRVEE
jgi:16S rRNA (cytosine967-C5)-methyltransferase